MKIDVSTRVTTDVYGSDTLVSASVAVEVPELADVRKNPAKISEVEAVRDEVHTRLRQLTKEIDAQLDTVAELAATRERAQRASEVPAATADSPF